MSVIRRDSAGVLLRSRSTYPRNHLLFATKPSDTSGLSAIVRAKGPLTREWVSRLDLGLDFGPKFLRERIELLFSHIRGAAARKPSQPDWTVRL